MDRRTISVRSDSINAQTSTFDAVWRTRTTLQQQRREGWDGVVKYDPQMIVTREAMCQEAESKGETRLG